ncbi:MAG: hypothetical protein JKY37_27555, partial [Nannocystaceae bacterium]|nr:hypothetical protein [Nannocystaceae bacterium]
DDRIFIQNACELQPGDVIDGGPGFDRVMSRVPMQALLDAEVVLRSIEKFSYYGMGPRGVCILQDPTLERIEVTGVPVSSEALWLALDGKVTRPEDVGPNLNANLSTRFEFRVHAVYNGDKLRKLPSRIVVYQPGGEIRTGNRAIISEPCCSPRLYLNQRVRLVLRELRTSEQETAYQTEFYTPLGGRMPTRLLPLGDNGPVMLSLPRPPSENPSKACGAPPVPFQSAAASVAWANVKTRWWQNSSLPVR